MTAFVVHIEQSAVPFLAILGHYLRNSPVKRAATVIFGDAVMQRYLGYVIDHLLYGVSEQDYDEVTPLEQLSDWGIPADVARHAVSATRTYVRELFDRFGIPMVEDGDYGRAIPTNSAWEYQITESMAEVYGVIVTPVPYLSETDLFDTGFSEIEDGY